MTTDEQDQPRRARPLPVVSIGGKEYFRDDRLQEFRARENPHDRLGFGEQRAAKRRSPRVELTHVHLEAHYAVVLGQNLYLIGVGCDGAAWVTEATTFWNASADEEERAVAAVLAYRERKPLFPSWLDCRCGGAR